MAGAGDFVEIRRGRQPVVMAFPHTGTELLPGLEPRLTSPWLARKDTDWWIDQLYDFVHTLGITTVRTRLSRAVIDVNRDPSGASLYPGMATTELCPTTSFDGEALYRDGMTPSAAEIDDRRNIGFAPYHAALSAEIDRLKAVSGAVVLYDAHAIRSRIPRLFDGDLPHFNIGTNGGSSCDPDLTARVEACCDASAFSRVTNGRFKGGWTTRHYGRPDDGVHALQMELACRGYMDEPDAPPSAANWPPPYDPARAQALRTVLTDIIVACVAFANSPKGH